MEMKVDERTILAEKRMKVAVVGILVLLAFLNAVWAQEVTARLLIEVQGKVAIEDGGQILQGDNGKLYLLQGKEMEGYIGKEVRVLGEPIIPPEDLKGKIRLVVNVLEIEEINQGGEAR
ncbi:MAG: hypothetical protein DRP73_04455 [Candidatus Omnitrophota bacterium]|nr:MAG: hypothetical protein DRP73_04455 [Candidatus Omnitrophota bacterium]